jgi:hypothetical protein
MANIRGRTLRCIEEAILKLLRSFPVEPFSAEHNLVLPALRAVLFQTKLDEGFRREVQMIEDDKTPAGSN